MQTNKLLMPIAIVVAGALIAGAVIYTGKTSSDTSADTTVKSSTRVANIKPVSEADHINGNPQAKVMIVEYSDTECPFCKLFHVTLTKIMSDFGANRTAAWTYRHFAIPSLHPRAPKEAEATECVNKLAGNEIFWKYLQKIYAVTPSNNKLDPAQLPILAAEFGVDKKAFQECLDSGIFTEKIQTAYNDAIAAGAKGTPYTVLVAKKELSDTQVKKINQAFASFASQFNSSADSLGSVTADKKVVLNGNLPYELVKTIVEAMTS